jgi:hypothetical protein
MRTHGPQKRSLLPGADQLRSRAFVAHLTIALGAAVGLALALATTAAADHAPAPTNLTTSNVTRTSITLSWSVPANSRGSFGVYLNGRIRGNVDTKSFTFSGLSCGRSYGVGVRTFYGGGHRSPIVTLTRSTAPCSGTGGADGGGGGGGGGGGTVIAPTNSSVPTIAGTAQVGSTLTASPGSWSGTSPMSYAYRWSRCNSAGAACTQLGQTGISYVAASVDVGMTLRVAVTASNSNGGSTAISAPTAVVTSGGGTPPPAGTCTVASTAGCVPGTTLTLQNQTWTCTRALSSYGTLPLKIVLNYTNNSTNFGVRLDAGCAGDANSSTVDLILDIRGNGQTYGIGEDAIRITADSPGASNIQITGHADCGRRTGSAHQDGIQALGGTNITFVDFSIGDYDGGVSTCQGAGGIVFYSNANGNSPRNMQIVRGKYIGCNHSLLDGTAPSSGSVTGASFRSGRWNMTTGLCIDPQDGQPYSASPPCLTANGSVTESGLTCQRWNRILQRWDAQ